MQNNSDGRKIIHIDMDCFFAAIEIRENPKLAGLPVAVGGSAERRGVLTTCSYEARKYGIRSAMPTATALKKCPDLILLPVRMPLYREVSARIQALFHNYTERVEPLSLDEAYLDVTDSSRCRGSATLIATEIRKAIFKAEGLTASAGIAPNKFLAKIASDWNKPNGQKVILPSDIPSFMPTLPVEKIPGVGKVTQEKLAQIGIKSCADLQKSEPQMLELQFGRLGRRLYQLSFGDDPRPVSNHRQRKSLSVETTFAEDLPSLKALLEKLPELFQKLLERWAQKGGAEQFAPKSLIVKIRFDNFETTTAQQSAERPTLPLYSKLIEQGWNRSRRPVRLLGIGLAFKEPVPTEQLSLNLGELEKPQK